MRWNCPHCGVGLNVPDEQLGEAWCFSKCYQCSGFSLVRRADQSAVRVDGSAPGVTGSMIQESPWRLSQRALDSIKPVAKPVIRPAMRKTSAVQDVAKEMNKAVVVPPPFTPKPVVSGLLSRPLPAPLPDRVDSVGMRMGKGIFKWTTRTLAAGVLAAVAIGVYTWVTTPIPVSQEFTANTSNPLSVKAPSVVSTSAVVTDSISRGAMAPERAKENEVIEKRLNGLQVEALSPRVQFRSGPGLQYSVVGVLGSEKTYPVIDWSERWFRVAVETSRDGTPRSYAWVRNDLVKLVKKDR